MSKITQNYIEARRDGIKWLNSQKRDYSIGVNILTRSGYKGFVAARLARQGEKPHTREKLEYEIRQMIKVWYHPDDPRFEDVDLADDAMPGNDGRSETVPEETAAAIVARFGSETFAVIENQPKMEGRNMHMLIAPLPAAVAAKKKKENEKKEAEGKDE